MQEAVARAERTVGVDRTIRLTKREVCTFQAMLTLMSSMSQVLTKRAGFVAAIFLVTFPGSRAIAAESLPTSDALRSASKLPQESFSDIPPSVRHVAPLLRQVVGVIQSSAEIQGEVKRLRTELDTLTTKRASVSSEFALVDRQQQQFTQQLAALERQQRERLESVRKELEVKLASEVAAARQSIHAEQEKDFARQLQAFEARQHNAVDKGLDQELELKARELDQLSEELDVQMKELLQRLARLDANQEAARSLERSTSQALARQKAGLDARRKQLADEHVTLLAKQRNEFIQQLRQQQGAELQQRLTVKEASLRSAMANLLQKTGREEAGKIEQIQQTLEEVKQRHTRLVQQQALLASRVEAMDRELASEAKSLQDLEAERQASLNRLEEAFKKPNPVVPSEALAWFGRTIRYLPPGVAAELSPLQQRLVVASEQEQRLQEQRRIVRERQLALELSREMESQHQQIRLRQQREQEARSRKAEELLDKANQAAGRGNFDEALQLVSQAQALNPPQLGRIAVVREEMVNARARRLREAKSAQIKQLFTQAMDVFEQGRYEEAVGLFEQVIAQEAKLDSMQVAGAAPR